MSFEWISMISASWVSAIGTLLAVIVALFVTFRDKRLSRAKLSLSVHNTPPDWCHVLRKFSADHEVWVFVPRFRVANAGPAAAKSVEAVLHNLEKRNENEWELQQNFLGGKLPWTDEGERRLPLLIPGIAKLVDLGEIKLQESLDNDYTIMKFSLPSDTDTSVDENLLMSGDKSGPFQYRFQITIAAENARPVSYTLKLKITGEWRGPGESKAMAKDGVALQMC